MLQRIQSIYLGLAFFALIILGSFPVVQFFKESSDISGKIITQKVEISAFEDSIYPMVTPGLISKFNVQNHIWHYFNLILWVLSSGMIFTSIFLFQNRSWQIRLCWISLFSILILSILIYLDINTYRTYTHDRTLGIGSFSISASLLLILLARKQIVKDENLLKSVDRLR